MSMKQGGGKMSKNNRAHDPIPKTAVQALAKWDAGDSVFTMEMGGLGPGYEQAIQVLVFEIVRDYLGKPLPKEILDWGDDTVHRLNDLPGFGFSGAQVRAAKHLAYRCLRDGWRKVMRSIPDRLIQVSRTWPNAPLP